MNTRRNTTVRGVVVAIVLGAAVAVPLDAAAQAIDLHPVEPLAASIPAPHARESSLRPDRPAWVVGNVPDTVWLLVEASVAAGDRDAARTLLREAEGLARASLVGHGEDPGRRFALAVVLGMRTDIEGGRTKVGVASELYEELGRLLELEPDHARGRYMMGRLHAGVRRMGGVTRWVATNLLGGATLKEASWAAAESHFVFAEQSAPEVPDHHLQLARLYLDTGRPERALEEVRHVLAMPAGSPLERVARSEAEELAAELADALRSEG